MSEPQDEEMEFRFRLADPATCQHDGGILENGEFRMCLLCKQLVGSEAGNVVFIARARPDTEEGD